MASLQLVDLVETTLSAGYTAGGTSLALTSTAGLPASGDYWLSVYDPANSVSSYEVFKVTGAPSAGTVPVTGAQSTTTAKNHSAGHIAYASVLTAAALTQFRADTIALAQSPWIGNIDAASFILNNAGKIGIGATAQAAIGVYVSSGSINDAVSQISSSASGYAGCGFQNDAGKLVSLRMYGSGSASPNLARLASDVDLAIFTASSERMRVTLAGNVGIHTASASEPLTVNGAIRVSGAVSANVASSLVMDFASGNSRLVSYGANTTASAGIEFLTIHSDGSGALVPMMITAAGNVGIGTQAPVSQLSIIPVTTPTTAAGANQFSMGEASNASGYNFTMGYFLSGGNYYGTLQSLAGGAGSPMVLNGAGGGVMLNAPQSATLDTPMPNSSYYIYLYEPGNQVAIRVKTSAGVIKQAVLTVA